MGRGTGAQRLLEAAEVAQGRRPRRQIAAGSERTQRIERTAAGALKQHLGRLHVARDDHADRSLHDRHHDAPTRRSRPAA